MILFGILFALNVVVALLAFAFFIVGLADGSVTSFNILIWGAMLGVLFSLPMAGWLMRVRGKTRVGTALLLPLAAVGVFGGLATLVLIVNPPNWQ